VARSAAQSLARGQMHVFCRGLAKQDSPMSLVDRLMCQDIAQYLHEEYQEQALDQAQQHALIQQERAFAGHGN